jgi:hypothetical protein
MFKKDFQRFYLITALRAIWLAFILFASKILDNHNRTRMASLLIVVGFSVGLLSPKALAHFFLSNGTLVIGVFAFICLLFSFIAYLSNVSKKPVKNSSYLRSLKLVLLLSDKLSWPFKLLVQPLLPSSIISI